LVKQHKSEIPRFPQGKTRADGQAAENPGLNAEFLQTATRLPNFTAEAFSLGIFLLCGSLLSLLLLNINHTKESHDKIPSGKQPRKP